MPPAPRALHHVPRAVAAHTASLVWIVSTCRVGNVSLPASPATILTPLCSAASVQDSAKPALQSITALPA
jgi:hypothetical protein